MARNLFPFGFTDAAIENAGYREKSRVLEIEESKGGKSTRKQKRQKKTKKSKKMQKMRKNAFFLIKKSKMLKVAKKRLKGVSELRKPSYHFYVTSFKRSIIFKRL